MLSHLFADNLITLRKSMGLTQEEFSKKLNISRQAYCNYEKCKRTPDIETIFQISQIHGVSIDDLLTNTIRTHTRERRPPYSPAEHHSTRDRLYLTDEEYNLILHYQTLQKEEQDIILALINKRI